MKAPAGEARKTAQPAISVGLPTRRRRLLISLCELIGVAQNRFREVGFDEAWGNRVRADVHWSPLDREIARQLRIGCFAHGIGRDRLVPAKAGETGNDNDRPVALVRHQRRRQIAKLERAADIDAHGFLVSLIGGPCGWAVVTRHPRVAHQNIYASQRLERPCDKLLKIGVDHDIQGAGTALKPCETNSFATSSHSFGSLLLTTTRAPARANSVTIALPMPRVAPVTIARLPSESQEHR